MRFLDFSGSASASGTSTKKHIKKQRHDKKGRVTTKKPASRLKICWIFFLSPESFVWLVNKAAVLALFSD